MPTKTDPATVPPLTDAEVATMIRESFREQHCLSSFDMNATDAEFVAFYSSATARIRAAYALAASRVDTAEVERRAARKALAECAAWLGKGESQPVRFDEDGRFLLAFERVNAFSDRYIAREYPAPAPRECVLSDGSVVWPDYSGQFARSNGPWCRGKTFGQWDIRVWDITAVLDSKRHTGADFDALKRFAAEVGR